MSQESTRFLLLETGMVYPRDAADQIAFLGPFAGMSYGFTEWNPKTNATFPKLEIDWTSAPDNKWTAVVRPTTAAMGAVSMDWIRPGEYQVPGKTVLARFPQCGSGGKRVPFFTKVDTAMSNLAKTAEMEHRSDYERAFELTLKKAADQINAIAGQTFGPDTRAKVEQEIVKQIGGKKPSQWVTQKLNSLTPLSKRERDGKGWHRLKPDGPPITCPQDCSKVQGKTVKAATTRIPGPPSSQVIK